MTNVIGSTLYFTPLCPGANKPTLEEMKQTPHHLVSILDPQTVYNAADWRNDALYVIQKLTATGNSLVLEKEDEEEAELSLQTIDKDRRNKIDQYIVSNLNKDSSCKILPIVTGGTMMYLQWLVHGCPDAAKPTQEALSRASQIIQSYQKMDVYDDTSDEKNTGSTTSKGWIHAVQYVASFGPIFAQRVSSLSENDWYRLRRTLEVAWTVLPSKKHNDKLNEKFHMEKLATETTAHDINETVDSTNDGKIIQSLYSGQRQGGLDTFNYDVRCFFLCPDDRMAHSKIVDRRCEEMILAGLITETTRLYLRGSLPPEGQQTRAIGYRQTLDYLLRSDWKEKDEQAFFNYLDEFTTATRRYAKKQMQWFRRDEAFVFIPVSLSEDNLSARVEAAAARIRELCIQSREEYTCEMSSMSQSAEIKMKNAMQSNGMKFYMAKRFRIVNGSQEMERVLEEADACVRAIGSNGSR